jgi:hypothetical protein
MQNVWIFQLDSALPETTKAVLLPQLQRFVADWKSHGAPVPGDVSMAHDRFVIVRADPGHASGCSIDSMTKGISEILASHGRHVMGPEFVLFRDGNGGISHLDFREVRDALLSGRLHAHTMVFDSSLGNSNDLSRWEQPLHQTWMGRFLPQELA